MIRPVGSFADLEAATSGLRGPALVAFFGDFSDKSRRTWPVFRAFCARHTDVAVHTVDVGRVKDVHRRLGVTVVPTVVVVKDGFVTRQVIGENSVEEYEAALLGGPPAPRPATEAPRAGHRVTVYTGSWCPWCTKAKQYLRQRGVPFTEIDVSIEPREADALLRRTGQTGVPQLDIDGQYVIGFDKARIDRLLGLGPQAGNGAW